MSSSSFSSKPSAWFKTKVLSFVGLILLSFLLVGCSGGGSSKKDTPRGAEKDLTGFTFGSGDVKPANINQDEQTVDIAIGYLSTNDGYFTNIAPDVTITGVSYSPNGTIDFNTSTPKKYTVTAEDGSNKTYDVTVKRAFVVSSETGLINAIGNITSDIAAGKPVNYITIFVTKDITLTNTIAIPDSWKSRNIRLENNNSGSSYVTITNLTTNGAVGLGWVSVVPPAILTSKDITGFTFGNYDIKTKPAKIIGTNIDIVVGYNITSDNGYYTKEAPNVTITGESYSPSGTIDLNTSTPKKYTVTALDGSNKTYDVTLRRAFVVSSETGLTNVINTITSDIAAGKPVNYITIFVQNDINFIATDNITIPVTWAGRNIVFEKDSIAPLVTIKGLTVRGDGTVGTKSVNIERVITTVVASGGHSLALDSNGKLWVTGYNEDGQLGLGNNINQTSFQSVTISGLPSYAKIVSVAAGFYHSFVLDSSGDLWATGYNEDGQLGLGNNISQTSFQLVNIGAYIISISAGDDHSLVLDGNGRVWASGYNRYGQLGLGNTDNQNTFVEVTSLSGKHITAIAAGDDHSLALDSEGKIWATGYGRDGALGLGNDADQNEFKQVTISGLSPSATIKSISAGDEHSLALDSEGKLWVTGYNREGELGLGNNINQNEFQQVTSGLISSANITSISAGNEHSLALDSDGKIWATGYGEDGALGLGNNNNQNEFQAVTISGLASGAKFASISAGIYHSLALDSNGRALVTGWNEYGWLGLGDYENRNIFTSIPSF